MVRSPSSFRSHAIDITVRCPHACRNDRGQSLAAQQASVAAKDGKLEKLARYHENASPISIETYGRVGYASIKAMDDIIAGFSSNDTYGARCNILSILRLELERALAYNIADVVLLSLGHCSGQHARRRRADHGE